MNPIPRIFSFLLFFPHISTSLSTHQSQPPPPISGDPTLIQKTCSTTTYADLCISSLQFNPGSTTADVRGLSSILLNLGAANATNTSSYASKLAKWASDDTLKKVLTGCASRYGDARDALRRSVDELAEEAYDYAYVHVSAAMEYPTMCRDLFKQWRPAAAYPAEMSRREEALEHLCTVALEIINLLV